MRSTRILLAIGFLAAAATAVPDNAEARRMGGRSFHGGGAHVAHFHGGGVRPGWHGGGTRWHGGGTRWAGGGRYYRGGYGWGGAAAGVATGAALGAAAAYGSSYGSSCYQQQWNGYTYVTVRVC
jgi:hypothetical protein